MRVRFSLRTVFLAAFVCAVLLWFFTPVAGIDSATCARIRPGMTEQQAQEIVGAPPGWYDGIRSFSSNAPEAWGWQPNLVWIGSRGEILVDLDDSGNVAQARFYPGKGEWSPIDWLWERFTRIKYAGLSVPARIVLHLALLAIIVLLLGIVSIRADALNQVALHGLIGLVAGFVLSVAIFSDGLFVDLLITSFVLSSPIIGAVVGIAVGVTRVYLPHILQRFPMIWSPPPE